MDNRLFSVGLNLDTEYNEYINFIERYGENISSVYFSLPLGEKFYSREEIAKEFLAKDSVDKLYRILDLLSRNGIKRELTLNINKLTHEDIAYAINEVKSLDIDIEEIVCLQEYGHQIKEAFPNVELKYSFNNIDFENIPGCFDTVVVGKTFLRDQAARHKLIKKGFRIVILLNNGCSFNCNKFCGNTDFCHSFVKENLKHHSPSELYAIQSIFPFELKRILEEDPFASQYRFKISNRPLGIKYTKKALSAYLSMRDVRELIHENRINYSLFGVMHTLGLYCDDFNYDEIIRIKNRLSI